MQGETAKRAKVQGRTVYEKIVPEETGVSSMGDSSIRDLGTFNIQVNTVQEDIGDRPTGNSSKLEQFKVDTVEGVTAPQETVIGEIIQESTHPK